ncbi:restriction endonuclease subunit S [Kribbella sp. NPDC004138]
MADWRITTWGQVVTLQRGYDITKDKQVLDGAIPVVSSGGISSHHNRSMNDGPGVIIGRKGTLGRVYYVDGPFWPHDTTLWVKDFRGNLPRFVYYALLTIDPAHLNVGSASPTLNRNHFHPLPVKWPESLDEQRAIAEVLEALDEKIAANERVVRSADELAEAHFRAIAAGKQVPLSSLARFVNGKAYTRDATGMGRVVVRIAELNSGIGASTVYNDIDVPEDHLARPGDLLFAWSGSLTATRWFRPEAIVNQHIFKVIPNAGWPKWLVNQAVHAKLDEFKAIAADKATTMGHIQRRHLDEPVSVPAPDEVQRVDQLMTGLWTVALAAEIESLKLAETRDELLPLLMSGRVRVQDAEKVVEGVL